MPESIFSPYQGAENRVTSAILAVFRSISIDLTSTILSRLLGDDKFSLIKFLNQAGQGGVGVPDAHIFGQTNIIIETKTSRNACAQQQLIQHLERIEKDPNSHLLVLTPDDNPPHAINEVQSDKIKWTSFGNFDQILSELLVDTDQFVSERDEFLIRNLRWLFADPRLKLLSRREVCVVAARDAWPDYNRTGFYRCQPTRSFRPVEYFAFYAEQAVQPFLARVIERYGPIIFSANFKHEDNELQEYVQAEVQDENEPEGKYLQVIKLSKTNDNDTKKVNDGEPIPHNPRGAGDAFTMGQRYVRLERFCNLPPNPTTRDLMDRD